jgi:large subunit ribosomal protein L10
MEHKAVENIPKKKIDAVKKLVNLIDNKRTVLIADISNIPGSQFQQISKKLRGKAIVKVPKKNLLFRALDDSKKEVVKDLKKHFRGATAILFSDMDSYELAGELLKIKSPSKAKPGQIAPVDLEVPAGPTELVPGPAISELGALGIQIVIQGGKIEIKEPKVVAEEGKEVSQGAADILGKLNILPFSIGFNPISAFDSEDNTVYVEIKINPEEAKEELLEAYSRALPFAVEIGYISEDTIKPMIAKAAAYERKLIRVINGEPEEIIEETPKEEIQEDTPEEKTKEEEKADTSAGLASLFG